MFDSDDRYDQLCTKCGMGRYHETSIHDDWDGVLHCTNKKCNHEVKRYKWKDDPKPQPEPVKSKLSPAAQVIWDAWNNAYEAQGPLEDMGHPLADALRAAADQAVPVTSKPNDTFCCPPVDLIIWKRVAKIRAEFLAIADELEGVKYGTYRCNIEEK